jgi:predicted nucleic acid-binding protein
VSVLLDAFALIAILRRGQAAIPAINLAEALDVLQRVQGIPRARLDAITVPLVAESLTLLAVDEPMARKAADIRARLYHRTRAPLSLADCVLLGAASSSDEVATADRPLIAAARGEGLKVRELVRQG